MGVLWRLRPYLRPHARRITLTVAASAVGMVAAVAVPLQIKKVVDGPLADGDAGAVLPLCLLVLVLGLTDTLLAMSRRLMLARLAADFERRLRDDLYRHLLRLPVAFHDEWQSGQLLSRAMTDAQTIRRFVAFWLIVLVLNGIAFAAIVVQLLRLNVALAALTLAALLPIAWLCLHFDRRYKVVSRRVQDRQGDLATVVEEAAAGVRVIKAFGRSGLLSSRYLASAERLREAALESVEVRTRFWPVIDQLPNLALAAVLLAGGLAVGNGALSLGGLVAFTSLVLMLVWPIESLGWILATGQEAATAARRIYEVLDTEPEVADRPGAADLPAARGAVSFRGVAFSYPHAPGWALLDVDLDVAPGETVALVGATGSGKSTLLALVPRLYDVAAGAVLLDGHDVRTLGLASLRRHVTIAFDEPLLFSASVRENLRFGDPDATDDELEDALAVAQARFVFDLPWGLDTRVGEQGLSLSGGQRQRLALARAIVAKPQVLVLDDPLSALDVHTEAAVERALATALAGTTTLVAVHRPSTLALADRVALLVDGRLDAVGTHPELTATNPTYRSVLGLDRVSAR
ncbi:MAG: ABC transporter ATP-binding protein [Acidimicrobiia bacterium]